MVPFVIEIKGLASGVAEYGAWVVASGPSSCVPWFGSVFSVLLWFHELWYSKKRPAAPSSYAFKVKVSRKNKIVFYYKPRVMPLGFIGFIWSCNYP